MRRVLAVLAAVALTAASAFSLVANVVAEPDSNSEPVDENDFSSRVVSHSKLPTGMHLAAGRYVYGSLCNSELSCGELLYGEDNYKIILKMSEEVDEAGAHEGDDKFFEIVGKYIDDFSYFPIVGDDMLIDFHIEDEDGEKVEDFEGDVTISFDFMFSPVDYDPDDMLARYLEVSSSEWEPGILHAKKSADGESVVSEILPATVEGNVWTFTTSGFSLFVPVMVQKVEEEAPKTADNTLSYVGLVAVSLAAFTTFGIYIRKTRR